MRPLTRIRSYCRGLVNPEAPACLEDRGGRRADSEAANDFVSWLSRGRSPISAKNDRRSEAPGWKSRRTTTSSRRRRSSAIDRRSSRSRTSPTGTPRMSDLPVLVRSGVVLPALIVAAGDGTGRRFLEFFTANTRNPNTRAAYARAIGGFCAWLDERGVTLERVEPMIVAAYVEHLGRSRSAATVSRRSQRFGCCSIGWSLARCSR